MKTKIFTLLFALFAIALGAKADGIHVSAADVGKVLCTDGSVYATVSEAIAAEKTPVAMLAYIDGERSLGLAIALADATDDVVSKCPQATSIAEGYNTTYPVVYGNWRLPSVVDWEYMLIGCGSTSTFKSSLPDSAPNNEIDDYGFEDGNIRSMMVAAGGNDFYHVTNGYGYWTTTTPKTVGGDIRWQYFFSINTNNTVYSGFGMGVNGLVRPCIEFVVIDPTIPTYTLTLQEGTEDAENWEVSPYPCRAGKSVELIYSGDKVVKSVKMVKSGQDGYSPQRSGLRRPRWIFTMPEYNDEIVVEYDESYIVITDHEDSQRLHDLAGTTGDVVFSKKIRGWTLLTLPFDLPGGFDPKWGMAVKQFVGSSYDAETHAVKLFFDDVTDLEAGRPYLVRNSSTQERDLFNYPFTGVTIKDGVMPLASTYGVLTATTHPVFYDYPEKSVLLFEEGYITTIQEYPYVIFEVPHTYYWDKSDEITGFSGYFRLSGNVDKVYSEDMVFEVVFGPYEPEEEPEVLGDVNGDGDITVTDVGMMISYILGGSPEGFNPSAADVNNDGQVTVTDVGALITMILSKE